MAIDGAPPHHRGLLARVRRGTPCREAATGGAHPCRCAAKLVRRRAGRLLCSPVAGLRQGEVPGEGETDARRVEDVVVARGGDG